MEDTNNEHGDHRRAAHSLHCVLAVLDDEELTRVLEMIDFAARHSDLTLPASWPYRGGSLRYSASPRSLLLSQSRYGWPLGMVAPEREAACTFSHSLV
jgi:hypothetical protein